MEEVIFSIQNFKLSTKDHLTYLLYESSNNKKVIRTRLRNRIIFIFLFLSIFIYVYVTSFNIVFLIFFIPFTIVMFLVREITVRNTYVKGLEKYIKNQNSESSHTTSEITFAKSFLLINESNSESKISYKDFDDIIEINECVFIKILNRSVLIINKNNQNSKTLIEHLKNISLQNNIPYQLNLHWNGNNF